MPMDSIPGWLLITHIPYLVTIVLIVLIVRDLSKSMGLLARKLPRTLKRRPPTP
jgi:hypothetical protein